MINVIGHRYVNLIFSGLLFVLAIVALVVFGLKPGNDFRGGSLLEARFTGTELNTDEVKNSLASLNFGILSTQKTDENGVLIKLRFLTEEEHQQVLGRLRTDFEKDANQVLEVRFETIGPVVSQELRIRSLYAIIIVVVGIVIYIAYSFRRISQPVNSWKYGVVAVCALLHDVTITAGIFALFGRYAGVEVDIPFVVALLTILGYSVNDTIVVFDRIRENLIRRSANNFSESVNIAVNETFSRSINTGLATMFTLGALFFFGGESIKYFVLTLLVGIFLGTYSSIFVASPLLVEWHRWQQRRSS